MFLFLVDMQIDTQFAPDYPGFHFGVTNPKKRPCTPKPTGRCRMLERRASSWNQLESGCHSEHFRGVLSSKNGVVMCTQEVHVDQTLPIGRIGNPSHGSPFPTSHFVWSWTPRVISESLFWPWSDECGTIPTIPFSSLSVITFQDIKLVNFSQNWGSFISHQAKHQECARNHQEEGCQRQ